MLGLPVRDATGGFVAWRAGTLEGMGLDGIEASGYGFQVELVRRAIRSGFTIAEVPIEFVEREYGDSKMSGGIVAEAMLLTTRWGLAYRFGQARQVAGQVGETAGAAAKDAGRTAVRLRDRVARWWHDRSAGGRR